MIRPLKASFYVYSESDSEIEQLQDALFEFVLDQYNRGKIVTASKLTEALKKFGGNPIITNYF